MRKLKSLCIPLLFLFTGVFAQQSNPAYELQRNKINGLLDNRARDYGQYQESLSKRTGIFGLKTKKDMQRSIDILTGIIATDNNILRETKVLLDYKDLEKSQVEVRATDTEQRISAYMTTIARLQKQNDALKETADAAEKKKTGYLYALVACLAAIAVLIMIITKKKLKG